MALVQHRRTPRLFLKLFAAATVVSLGAYAWRRASLNAAHDKRSRGSPLSAHERLCFLAFSDAHERARTQKPVMSKRFLCPFACWIRRRPACSSAVSGTCGHVADRWLSFVLTRPAPCLE